MDALAELRQVCLWPFAAIRSDALNGRYRRHSGHWAELALIASVVNDINRE
jgi:hypothetical protein